MPRKNFAVSAVCALVFNVLPVVFAEIPGGRIIGSLFFLLLTFAALTPSLAGFEPIVAWLQQRHVLSRPKAVLVATSACWLLGIGSVLSFNIWAAWRPLGMFPMFAGMTYFDVMDYLSANVLLPAGALCTSIFVGWRIDRMIVAEELGETMKKSRRACVWLLRYACPIATTAVLFGVLA